MKTLKEQIEVMKHFANGGKVDYWSIGSSADTWYTLSNGSCFNWGACDYRIVERKKTITIEKWLCKDLGFNCYIVIESDKIDEVLKYNSNESICKDKLLETYEVEL